MSALLSLSMGVHIAGVAVLGLVFGSFISAISYRLAQEERQPRTRSHCPKCGATLTMRDLVPVLSWLVNGGKCRHCSAAVSIRYPLIELTTMLSFVGLFLLKGLTVEYVLLAALSVCVVTLIATDLEHYIIPDEIQIAMGLIALAYGFVTNMPIDVMIVGALVAFSIGLLLHYGYYFLMEKHGLGFGDVKFLFVVGLFLGAKPLVPFLFASGVLGVLSAMLWRLAGQGKVFPFGPALAFAMVLFLLCPELSELFWNLGQARY